MRCQNRRILMKKALLTLCLLASVFADEVESDNTFSNTNFVQNAQGTLNSVDFNYKFDYNRFRWENKSYFGDFSSYLAIDNDSILGPSFLDTAYGKRSTNYTADVPFETSKKLGDNAYDRAKVYRALVKYEGDQHALTLGLQRVAFGVGRIWSPVDMFNPLKSLSLESSERAPVLASHYNYAFSDTGSIDLVVSLQENNDTKGAIRIKDYIGFADMGLVVIKEKKRQLLGYVIEGHLFDTGVEFRSEGGYFSNTDDNKSFVKLIAGADYGFENSLTFTVEYLYNQTDYSKVTTPYETISSFGKDTFTDVIEQQGSHYLAGMVSYTFSTLLSGRMITMYSMEDYSGIVIPTLAYSLSDEMVVSLGGFVSFGADDSEFGTTPLLLFSSFSVTF